jgi:hypothetical protein
MIPINPRYAGQKILGETVLASRQASRGADRRRIPHPVSRTYAW